MTDLRLRQAVRALLIDDAGRALLARFVFPPDFAVRELWALPGGGVEGDEDDHTALRREMLEELGLTEFEIGPHVWTRTKVFPMTTGHDGQIERAYLVRIDTFEPQPALSWAELRAEFVHEFRWWTADELASTPTTLAPRALADLFQSLLEDGPSTRPVDIVD